MTVSPALAPETAHVARLGDRSLFPHLEPRVYANHAGISAPSVAVSEAAQRVYADYERRGARSLPAAGLRRPR